MHLQESGEMYLETIHVLLKKNGQVRSIDICNELGHSKPTVSVAMKNFRENGYINMDDDYLITLTETGAKLADVDLSTSVNIKDATAIQKYIAGMDTGYDIGKTI